VETIQFFLKNLILISSPIKTLPGAFAGNPYPNLVNPSLWTLPVEVRWYILSGVIYFSLRNSIHIKFITVSICILAWIGASSIHIVGRNQFPEFVVNFFNTFPYFLAGAAAFLMRDRLRYLPLGCFLAIAAMFFSRGIDVANAIISLIAIPYVVMGACLGRTIAIDVYLRKYDVSYGMFIYSFPIQQIVESISQTKSAGLVMAISFPLTILASVVSWHFVERRFLELKKKVPFK